ncbi:argininosuccinate synthase [Candidatus Shapirobacteria bacterium]|nr:argininosuccinate synthase [Candidatus Shapirobacteria bacterium]
MTKKKVILAFSGGLDTSFSVPYLIDKNYEVITMTVDTGGFSPLELKSIAKKSKKLGAIRHHQIDGKKAMFETLISYIIKTNGLYENSYPNMCADRYIIVEQLIKIAKKEKTKLVAHGSTAMGNDQIRFDVALMTIAPGLKIITPIREMGGDRKKEQRYLANKGFLIDKVSKKYTVNQNILGMTYSGAQIDKVKEPDETMFIWTKAKKTKQRYISIVFSKGIPISLNGKSLAGFKILQKLNEQVGSFGYGRGYYTGNCVVGIKGHIVFEAPGILALIKAHLALEQLVLTKHQLTIGQFVNQQFTDFLFSGKFYEPVVKNLKKFIDSQQERVCGEVVLKLNPGQVQAVELKSPFSLINPKIATYAQECTWSTRDAEGFIKLYGLQSKIAVSLKKGDRNH